jgi:hypothetical protein
MSELRNSYYDTVFASWQALIGPEAVLKRYYCIEKLAFRHGFVMWLNNVPLYGIACDIIIGAYLNGCR